MHLMKFISHSKNRAVYGLAAVFLFVATAVSFLAPGKASAAQVTTRSIQMSSSTQGAAATYKVQFTVATTAVIQGVVVDFCDNSPLIGDATCTKPTGFSVGTPTVANITGLNPTTGWTAGQLNTNRTLTLTNGSAGSVTAAAVVSFELTTAVNPTTDNHTFYARILTYTTSAGATSYVAGTEGSYTDYGGIAMSTGKVISITARVMESLAFCVYKTACGDNPSLTLGHGGNLVLDTTATDTDTANFSLSTNAQSGAVVRIKGNTLTSGSNTIAAVGATAGPIAAGSGKFGLYLSALGSMSVAAPYTTSSTTYAYDSASTSGTYGDDLATIATPINNSVTTITFGASAATTTAAGIYTAPQQLIATGTF
jgi:hypothetical protein